MRLGTFMQSACTLVGVSIVSNSYAVDPGFYMGLMTGPATNTAGTQYVQVSPNVLTAASPKSSQWGTRLFMGYKINPYAGAEGGISLFSKIKYETKDVQACTTPSARVRDFDLVGKGSVPLSAFEVFGKAGVALTYLATSGSLHQSATDPCGRNEYVTKFRPTLSLGASYDLSQSWVMDFSWNRIMVGGAASNVDHYALGISYHFVDVYCGQFLC